MNLFSRITATIGASAETAVSRFENHDAIAQTALTEARQAVARARIRHQRLQKSVGEIRANLHDLETQAQQWTHRAQKLGASDQQRALQCLEQRQACRNQIVSQTDNLARHQDLEAGMADRLRQMEARLQSLCNQRSEMQSRESLAKATQVMDRVGSQSRDGVDAIFERWELSISDTEMRNDAQLDDVTGVSTLQRELDEEERQAALQDELAALLLNGKESTND